jgi:LysR family transcriptional regulator for bpeEF and oprC
MDRLTALSVFRCVAETRSFSKAGARLGMAPSSVSKSIARLEASLGVRLLARTTRVVSLTDDGAAYFESVRTALASLDEAETVLKRSASEPSGLLRIALPLSFGRRRIVPHLPAFLDRYPDLELDVRLSDEFSRPIDEGIDALVRVGEGRAPSLTIPTTGVIAAGTLFALNFPYPELFANPSSASRREILLSHVSFGASTLADGRKDP